MVIIFEFRARCSVPIVALMCILDVRDGTADSSIYAMNIRTQCKYLDQSSLILPDLWVQIVRNKFNFSVFSLFFSVGPSRICIEHDVYTNNSVHEWNVWSRMKGCDNWTASRQRLCMHTHTHSLINSFGIACMAYTDVGRAQIKMKRQRRRIVIICCGFFDSFLSSRPKQKTTNNSNNESSDDIIRRCNVNLVNSFRRSSFIYIWPTGISMKAYVVMSIVRRWIKYSKNKIIENNQHIVVTCTNANSSSLCRPSIQNTRHATHTHIRKTHNLW